MTILGELSTFVPVLFPCATAAPLQNDTGTGIGFPHSAADRRPLCGTECFPSCCRWIPQRTQQECFAGACCRWIPQRTQRRNALPGLFPLIPPADPTTECFAGACCRWVPQRTQRRNALPELVRSLSPPADPTASLQAHETWRSGAPTAGVPCSAVRVCGAPADQQVRMAQVAALRALTTSGPRLKRRKRQKGCRNTGSGRWRPLGGLLNDCWRAPKAARLAVLCGGQRRLTSQEMNRGQRRRLSGRAEAGHGLVPRLLWESRGTGWGARRLHSRDLRTRASFRNRSRELRAAHWVRADLSPWGHGLGRSLPGAGGAVPPGADPAGGAVVCWPSPVSRGSTFSAER